MTALRRCLLPSLGIFLILASPVSADPPAVRTDAHGDPLPPGARARLGSTRLWHGPTVTRLVFAPDGKTFFSAADDFAVRQWNAATGQEVRAFTHPEQVRCVSLSPDGKYLATADMEQTVRLWNAATGQQMQKWHREELCAGLAFAPDSKTLALVLTGREKPYVCLWDVTEGKEVRQLPMDPPNRDRRHMRIAWARGGVIEFGDDEATDSTPTFSADGRHLAVGQNITVLLWDLTTGKKVRRYESLESNRDLRAVLFAPDGESLTALSDNGRVCRWEVGSAEELPPLRGPNTPMLAAAYARDGKALAVAGQDGQIRIWEPASGKLLREMRADSYAIRAVGFAPDGKTLACGDYQGVIRLWDLTTGKEKLLAGPRPSFHSLGFTADGALVSADFGEVRRWDGGAGKETGRLDLGVKEATCLILSPDGGTLAVAHQDGKVTLLDAATGKEHRALEGAKAKGGQLLFSPDGRSLVLSGVEDGRYVCLFDVPTGREVWQSQNKEHLGNAVTFASDGKTLIAGNSVLELATGKTRRTLHHRWSGPEDLAARYNDWSDSNPRSRRFAYTLRAVSPDSKLLAMVESETVALIQLSTGKVLRRCEGHQGAVFAVAFSPDGALMATGSYDRTVRLWDVSTGKEIGPLRGHRAAVRRLVFSADGKTLASAGEDRTALLWDVAESLGVARRAPTSEPTPRTPEDLWADLAHDDVARADVAIRTFVALPEQAVPFLKTRLQPAAPLEAGLLDRLLADLDSPQFETREKATKELEILGDRAEAALRKYLTGEPTPEGRKRAQQLLDRVEKRILTAEQLRILRALEVLEQIGGVEARKVLTGLAAGAADDRQTREAKAALERLNKGMTP
jgi:WD40 repeat protein